jgi:hypothetical protein
MAAPVGPASRSAHCPPCAGLARSRSVAADTCLDDPRPFAVYLAHHGTVIKVGITAVERGLSRLLEQGALASAFISTGTLASARAAEHLLTTALDLRDRVTTAHKRAARAHPAPPAKRAADLATTAENAQQLTWPIGQARCSPRVTDHAARYGLPQAGLHPDAEMLPLAPGSTITGTVACHIGTDVYLSTPAGLVLLDTRLLAGWSLALARPGDLFTAPCQPLQPKRERHDVLF